MTRKIQPIPRDLIKHLGWNPNQPVPPEIRPPISPPVGPPTTGTISSYNIDDLLDRTKVQVIENSETKNGKNIGLAVALKQMTEAVGVHNIVSMPALIAAKSKADKSSNYLWKNWFAVTSEENIGIDKKGLYVPRGQPVVLTVHGGGILNHERIFAAYAAGLTPQNAATLTESEFDNLLEGKLPDGQSINIYSLDDVKSGRIIDPFGRYAVALDFSTTKPAGSGHHAKSDFMNNPLVMARAGTLEYLDAYFEKAKSNEKVGNWHRHKEIDPDVYQGRVLFVSGSYDGLVGDFDLSVSGRFVGVGAEGAGRPK